MSITRADRAEEDHHRTAAGDHLVLQVAHCDVGVGSGIGRLGLSRRYCAESVSILLAAWRMVTPVAQARPPNPESRLPLHLGRRHDIEVEYARRIHVDISGSSPN